MKENSFSVIDAANDGMQSGIEVDVEVSYKAFVSDLRSPGFSTLGEAREWLVGNGMEGEISDRISRDVHETMKGRLFG